MTHADEEDDGLTDELAAAIHAELEGQDDEERRPHVTLRPAPDGSGVELVLCGDGDDAPPPVVTTLSAEDALALAAGLVHLAG